jgi:hypothetical protein
VNNSSDLIGLLTTVDLGLLSAALTMLTLFPAISALVSDRLSKARGGAVVNYDLLRRRILNTLMGALVTSMAALVLVLLQSGVDFFGSRAVDLGLNAPLQLSQHSLDRIEFWVLALASALSGGSILFAGRSGWLIFKATADNS